jgi:hypothetical protein
VAGRADQHGQRLILICHSSGQSFDRLLCFGQRPDRLISDLRLGPKQLEKPASCEPDDNKAKVGRHLPDREPARWRSREGDDDIEDEAEQSAYDGGLHQTAVAQVIRKHPTPIRSLPPLELETLGNECRHYVRGRGLTRARSRPHCPGPRG